MKYESKELADVKKAVENALEGEVFEMNLLYSPDGLDGDIASAIDLADTAVEAVRDWIDEYFGEEEGGELFEKLGWTD